MIVFDSLGVGIVIAGRHIDCGLLHLAEESINDGIEEAGAGEGGRGSHPGIRVVQRRALERQRSFTSTQIKVVIFSTAIVPTTARDRVVF